LILLALIAQLDRLGRVRLDVPPMNRRNPILVCAVMLAAFALPAGAIDAATIYADRCAFCHGLSGRGDGPAGAALEPPPRDLTSADYWKSTDPATIENVITNGKPGSAMVAFKGTLSPAEIDALVDHLKTFNPLP
jgi:high-affinity iron transporter